MKLKGGRNRPAGGSARERKPFDLLSVDVSGLETLAKTPSDARAGKAVVLLAAATRALGREVQNLAPPAVQDRYDSAKFALGRVVKSASTPELRAQAFRGFGWDEVSLRSFLRASDTPPDIRKLARARLASGDFDGSCFKPPGEPPTGNIRSLPTSLHGY